MDGCRLSLRFLQQDQSSGVGVRVIVYSSVADFRLCGCNCAPSLISLSSRRLRLRRRPPVGLRVDPLSGTWLSARSRVSGGADLRSSLSDDDFYTWTPALGDAQDSRIRCCCSTRLVIHRRLGSPVVKYY